MRLCTRCGIGPAVYSDGRGDCCIRAANAGDTGAPHGGHGGHHHHGGGRRFYGRGPVWSPSVVVVQEDVCVDADGNPIDCPPWGFT